MSNEKPSLRKKSPYLDKKEKPVKFCIGKCQTEFIPKDGMLQLYCPSCDRVKAERPIKT